MESLAIYPSRNLVRGAIFMVAVWTLATLAYWEAGWSFQDALYMVTLTVFTVGYGEVRPIDTMYLHVVTMATMAVGCTGMIFLTGALIQFMTFNSLQQILGTRRVQAEIDKLENHVIVCGYGRMGVELSRALRDGRCSVVVVEQNDRRVADARAAGHLVVQGDATNEATLQDAGIDRARALASVLPNDATNVFITLSARSLNSDIEVIARGDAVSTERKLLHAGADKVVLPTHIGAERIAEMLLFPDTSRFIRDSDSMRELERTLRFLGLAVEVIVVPEQGALTDLTVGEIEAKGLGAFFIVQINRHEADPITRPEKSMRVHAGDGIVAVSRSGQPVNALFAAPREKVRAGRVTF
ncbi:MAG: potassium channel protein [Bradyrhizobiaceae bacterium]|nr:MAG: potassium channel protein [Bradyrhizobiaceae bacterium]